MSLYKLIVPTLFMHFRRTFGSFFCRPITVDLISIRTNSDRSKLPQENLFASTSYISFMSALTDGCFVEVVQFVEITTFPRRSMDIQKTSTGSAHFVHCIIANKVSSPNWSALPAAGQFQTFHSAAGQTSSTLKSLRCCCVKVLVAYFVQAFTRRFHPHYTAMSSTV